MVAKQKLYKFTNSEKTFAARDLLGGEKSDCWNSLPMSVLVERFGEEQAAKEVGWLLSEVLDEDSRHFIAHDGYVKEYSWDGKELLIQIHSCFSTLTAFKMLLGFFSNHDFSKIRGLARFFLSIPFFVSGMFVPLHEKPKNGIRQKRNTHRRYLPIGGRGLKLIVRKHL